MAALLIGFAALGALGWLWLNSTRRADIHFLPRIRGAEWILNPAAPEVAPRRRVSLETDFKRTFILSNAPANARIRVAGFCEYSLSLNGVALQPPSIRGRNWKQPDVFDLTHELRPGQNEISVRVINSNGPVALWLALEGGDVRVASDETWQASCAGADWAPARLASRPRLVAVGGPLAGGEDPWTGIRARWGTLLAYALASAAIYWFALGWSKSSRPAWQREIMPIAGLALLWGALFVNNFTILPLQGFDVEGHLAYVTYLLDRHALPQANEGWEMFQPPLYYMVCAGLLKVLGLHTWQDEAIAVLRFLGLAIGVLHFVIVLGCLRLLFPESKSRQMWGLLLAGCLPALLYLSQFITNEAVSAMTVSACVYFTLRLLKSEDRAWRWVTALGLCLGAALLTKITAVLLLPVVVVALLWKKDEGTRPSLVNRGLRVGLVLVLCAVVCGWQYARVWVHSRHSSGVAWIPNTEIEWWQDDGFRTGPYYLRFGHALTHPWFSGFQSFPDGLYSTLWGDGLYAGAGDSLLRPPWNYDLMALGYWLALLPTLGLLIGAAMAIGRFIRRPSPEWFLLLGLTFLVALAVLQLSLTVPYGSVVKAFYGLSAMVPLCAFASLGLDFLYRRAGRLRLVVCILFGVWALNSFLSLCVSGSATTTTLARARNLAKNGRTAQAVQTLVAGLQSNPQSAELHCLLAEILMPVEQTQDALNHATMAVAQNSSDVENHLAMAMALAQQNRIDEAAAETRQALELAPGNLRALSQLTALQVRQGSYETAERLARNGLVAAPFNAELRLQLGAALINLGKYEEGMTQLQRSSSLRLARSERLQTVGAGDQNHSPSNAGTQGFESRLKLAAEFLAQGNTSQAIAEYQALAKTNPHSEVVAVGIGEALSKQGDFDEAAKQLEQALRAQPGYVPALMQLGVVRARQGKLDEGRLALAEAVQLQPENAAAHNFLGNVLAQQGRPEEAIVEFQTTVRLKPDLAIAHNNLALNYKKAGRGAEAIAHYREALRLQPDFLEPMNNLAWALATLPEGLPSQRAEAVTLAARACEVTQYQKPVPLATFAVACAGVGRYGDAIAYAERAQALVGGQGGLGTMLGAMLETFRAHQPYRGQ